jgi:hypothetical protein
VRRSVGRNKANSVAQTCPLEEEEEDPETKIIRKKTATSTRKKRAAVDRCEKN